MNLTRQSGLTVAVHDGVFHSDDVAAIACLRLLYPDLKVIRTRNPDILKTCDMRIDVGGAYNPSTGDYDHHMPNAVRNEPYKWAGKTVEGPTKSGVGLIWTHFGEDIIAQVLADVFNISPQDRAKPDFAKHIVVPIFKFVQKNVIIPIDIEDNGEGNTYFARQIAPYRHQSIGSFVKQLTPTDYEMSVLGKTFNDCFFEAVDMVQQFLVRFIMKQYEIVKNVDYISSILNQQQGKLYIKLDHPCAWMAGISILQKDSDRATPAIKAAIETAQLVVYPVHGNPDANGNNTYTWMVQSLKTLDKTTRCLKDKCLFAQNLRGIPTAKLLEETGIPSIIFIHPNGHLGGTQTEEDAIKLAELNLMMNGWTL